MGKPTAAECTKYRARHDEAEQALHSLLTGGREEQLRMGEKAVTYTRATVPELQKYVAWLKTKVDACDGKCGAGRRMIAVVPGDSR